MTSVEQPESAPARVVFEIRSAEDLRHFLRRRAEEVEVSRPVLDQLTGLSAGYSAHVLADRGCHNLSLNNAALLVPALGLKLAVVEDPEQLARMAKRWPKRASDMITNAAPIAATSWQLAGELRRKQGRKAGLISARRFSKPERIARARNARLAQ